MSYLVTLGETMGLFRSAGIGPLATETEFRLGVGGSESNVAIGVTRLGGKAKWIGRVGGDSLGERVTHDLRGEGLDVRAIVDSDASTGLMIKEARTAEIRRVIYYRAGSAGSRLQPSDIDPELISRASVLHVTGITPALSDSAAAAAMAAIDVAAGSGVPISFDVNHREALWSTGAAAPVYQSLAARATIVFAGEEEAALLADGRTPGRLARQIAEMGPSQVIVKMGSEGCVAFIDDVEYSFPAVAINPVDTVGAGDAFVAGYLTELIRDAHPEERLNTAVLTGAFACLSPGDWEGYAWRDELALLEASEKVVR